MIRNKNLLDKYESGQKVTYKDIGLDTRNYIEDTDTLDKGLDLASDIDIFREIGVSLIIIIGATIALHMFITK